MNFRTYLKDEFEMASVPSKSFLGKLFNIFFCQRPDCVPSTSILSRHSLRSEQSVCSGLVMKLTHEDKYVRLVSSRPKPLGKINKVHSEESEKHYFVQFP